MSPKLRALFVLLALCALAAFAYTTFGHLDGLIPGEQRLFLSPSGHLVALPQTGGRPVESEMQGAVQVAPLGWRPAGPVAVLSGAKNRIAFPAKSASGAVALIIRDWLDGKKVGTELQNIELESDAQDFSWISDTLIYLASGNLHWINPTSNPISKGSSASGINGIANNEHDILGWSGKRLLKTKGAQGSTWEQQFVSNNEISSAGYYLEDNKNKWVFLDVAGNLHFENGLVKNSPIQGRILSDNQVGHVLIWQSSTGDVWRVGKDTSYRIAHGVSDIMSATGTNHPEKILLGGTMAAGTSLLGDGIVHVGTFHQPGRVGIGSMNVDPIISSPGRMPINVTIGILAPGAAEWNSWIKSPSGDSIKIGSGTTLPVGLLSLKWNSSAQGSGKYCAYIEVKRETEYARDSVEFILDAVPPVDLGIWTTKSATVSPTSSWIADLNKAVDDGDITKKVQLVLRLKDKDGISKIIRIERSDVIDGLWNFDGRLPDGSRLPEGDYDAVWTLVDAAGNASDSSAIFGDVSTGQVRVRWGGPQFTASITPVQVGVGAEGLVTLNVAILGTSKSNVEIRFRHASESNWKVLQKSLDEHGRLELVETISLPKSLSAGVTQWIIEVKEDGRTTQGNALLFVGSAMPKITWPVPGYVAHSNEGGLVIRGIAPDQEQEKSGPAIYRISAHSSAVSVSSTTSWKAMEGIPGLQLLTVSGAGQAAATASLTMDRTGIKGTVGQAARLATESDLATLDLAGFRDSSVLITLWVGKGDLVNTDTVRIRILPSQDSIRGISLRLDRPSTLVLDRTDEDKINDSLIWHVAGAEGRDVSASVWSESNNPRKVWWTHVDSSNVIFGGVDNSGIQLPSGKYRLNVVARSLENSWSKDEVFDLVNPAQKPSNSLLQIQPNRISLGASRVSGLPIFPSFKVGMGQEDSVRIVVSDDGGHSIAVLGPFRARVIDSLWNGIDDSGLNWMDPLVGPASKARSTRLTVKLEHETSGDWQVLDQDTLILENIPTQAVQGYNGIFVDGQSRSINGDLLTVANLQSDIKLRGRMDGSLLYFPPRKVNFDIRPFGWQVARQWKPVDYQVEWAKYYNSLAGYQNWSGTWEADGFYTGWDCGWIYCIPVGRHTRQYDYPSANNVPFWMMANAGDAGIGERDTMTVMGLGDVSLNHKVNEKIGIPPRYMANLDNDDIVIERESGTYRFNPSLFFGAGKNTFKPNDGYTTQNSGYSGLHSGSPLEAMLNATMSQYKTTSKYSNWKYCRDAESGERAESPKYGTFTSSRADSRTFSPMASFPKGYSSYLEKLLINKLSDGHPEWRVCPGRDSLRKTLLCEKNFFGEFNGADYTIKPKVLVDTSLVRWNADVATLDSLQMNGEVEFVDSLNIENFAVTMQSCKDSTLSTVLLNRERAGFVQHDTITFQEYLDSLKTLAAKGSSWNTADDIGARVELDRQYVGIMDEAFFDPLPEVWNQYFYIYPPGYRKPKSDSLGILLYGVNAISDIEYKDNGAGYSVVDVKQEKSTTFGEDRLSLPKAVQGAADAARDKFTKRPGVGRWYFLRMNEWVGSEYLSQYSYDDIFQGGSLGNNVDAMGTLSLRNNVAYTVAPHINWMDPWFYMHDPKVTVVRKRLYATDTQSIEDGLRWDVNTGGRTIRGMETYGGYKEGQVGYWFRPSSVSWDTVKGDTIRRIFPKNHEGNELSEADFIENYAKHVGPDSSNLSKYTNHDLRFTPRLAVNDVTRGVVWDTVSVPWPRADYDFLRPDHLDGSSLADTGLTPFPGRNWAGIDTVLWPDSNWTPNINDYGNVKTMVGWSLRDKIPNMPDEPGTGRIVGGRPHQLYGHVRANSLRWAVTPRDSLGMLVDHQGRIQWTLDTSASEALVWDDVWKQGEVRLDVKRASLQAGYVLIPDTLGNWSSSEDALLRKNGGWLHLKESSTTDGFAPRRTLSLMPPAPNGDEHGNVPCYRPWIASAYVMKRSEGQCTDSLVLNPNLLLSGSKAKWDLELYYPDGQTPNRDFVVRSGASLSDVALGLSESRSSQRWVRLKGQLVDTILESGKKLPLQSWTVQGAQNSKSITLDLPRIYTDSSDLKLGIHEKNRALDPWTTDSTPDMAWWNVTGLWGNARFVVLATYGNGDDAVNRLLEVPFVIGEPSRPLPMRVTDAYGRASLDLPADSSGSRPPVVLHTLSGSDLVALPLRGASPIGPVIQMSPSGTRFDGQPATLKYSLTIRELLAAQGKSVSSDVLVTSKNTVRSLLAWAQKELAVWVISDGGDFEKVPTEFQSSLDTSGNDVTLDYNSLTLVGTVRHFSYAAILNNDISKSIPPRWIAAEISSKLILRLDLRAAQRLGSKTSAGVEIRFSTSPEFDTSRFLDATLHFSALQNILDTNVLIPSALADANSLNWYAYARYADGLAWSGIQLKRAVKIPALSGVVVDPSVLKAACTDSARIRFVSDVQGKVRAKVVGSDGSISWLQSDIDSGINTLTWPVCVGQVPYARGIYRALVEAVDADGIGHADSTKHLAIWGIDTTPMVLGTLNLPERIVLPYDMPVTISAVANGWSIGSKAIMKLRRERDLRGMSVPDAWMELPMVSTHDSLHASWVPGDSAQAGRWIFELQVQDGEFTQIRTGSLWADSSSLEAVVVGSPSRVIVGDQVRIDIASRDAATWQVDLHSQISSSQVGNGTGAIDRAFWVQTDTLVPGAYFACLQVNGMRGNVIRRCDSVMVESSAAKLIATRNWPSDTLWVGWPTPVLSADTSRHETWSVEGSTSRGAKILMTVKQNGKILRHDTIAVAGKFIWTWDGCDSSGSYAQNGSAEIGMVLLGGDQSLQWPLFVHRVPRVFVWPGRVASQTAEIFASSLRARGVTVVVGDALNASRYLDATKRGTLVLLDSALAPELWAGAGSGRLMKWSQEGGNLVFFGAPAFSARLIGTNVLSSTGIDRAVTMGVYGIRASSSIQQKLQSSFVKGIRSSSIKVDSSDAFAENYWPEGVSGILPWAQKIGWFRDAGVEVEAGLVGRTVDTVAIKTRLGRDTFELDTVLFGTKLFYPPQEDGPRVGALLELPGIMSGNAAFAASLVWADLFVPDLSIASGDVVVRGIPAKPRDSKAWTPIPGDSISIAIMVRVRDGGAEKLPDSLSIRIPKLESSWPETILKAAMHSGTVAMPIFKARISKNMTYGDHSFEVIADTLKMMYGDLLVSEQILRNNRVSGNVRIGDTARPVIRWVDSVHSVIDGIPVRVEPIAPGHSIAVKARSWTRHGQTGWSARWHLAAVTGQRIARDSAFSSEPDSVKWEWDPKIAGDATHGSHMLLRLAVQDTFGNSDTARLKLLVDGVSPIIQSVTVGGLKPEKDSTTTSMLFLPGRSQIVNDSAPLRIIMSDETMLGRILLIEEESKDTAILWDSTGGKAKTYNGRIKVLPDSLFKSWKLVVQDRAGNDTSFNLRVVRDAGAPKVIVFRVRTPGPNGLVHPTRMDTLNTKFIPINSIQRFVDSLVSNGSTLMTGKPQDYNGSIWASPDGVAFSTNVKRNQPIDLVLSPFDIGKLDSIWVTCDGALVDSSYLRLVDPLLQKHPNQRLVRITPTRSQHRMVFGARDMAGNVDSLVAILTDSLADLQVIDSAGDGNDGPDWGEVYMRRDVWTPPGLGKDETWDYWLVQRRNPLLSGHDDQEVELLVDADDDSTTGDQSLEPGFRGADLKLRWRAVSTADNGSAIDAVKFAWDPETESWSENGALHGEGLNALAGFSFDANQADDPTTDALGEGDQRLPSDVVAKTAHGVTEIGLRSIANNRTLGRIRWAIVPVDGTGDTVRSADGAMLGFEPSAFKKVEVDGVTSDWWPDISLPVIETRSVTKVHGDTVDAAIGIRNSGTQSIHGFSIKYWFESVEAPRVVLAPQAGSWKSLSVEGPTLEASKGPRQWSAELRCDSCTLVGGTDVHPIGRLLLIGKSVAARPSDDWSMASNANLANPRLPAYDPRGRILSGSEPPYTALLAPIARILPAGSAWVRIGETLQLDASTSVDPEGGELGYVWSMGTTGRVDTAMRVAYKAERLGVDTVHLRVWDRENPEREDRVSLAVFVHDVDGGVGNRPVRSDSAYLFDDTWHAPWTEGWESVTFARATDSVRDRDGVRHELKPARGTRLLSLPFDSTGIMSIRASCDSTWWQEQNNTWCHDQVDLAHFTNLEFSVAYDGNLNKPIRVWLTRTTYGQGNNAGAEEDFAYVASYLPDPESPSSWQKVSIPLSEMFTEPERKDRTGWLQLKWMVDDPHSSGVDGHRPRVLMDDIKLVRYESAPGEIVTTRKSAVQVLANTNHTGSTNSMGMAVRLLNAGSIPVSLDSLRMRTYYRTQEGELHSSTNGKSDTLWGADAFIFASHDYLPKDSTINHDDLAVYQGSLTRMPTTWPTANQFMELRLPGRTALADAGLRLRPTASATIWEGVVNGNVTIGNILHSTEAKMRRFEGIRSMHWSWPDSADIYQFAPNIVLDHQRPDGSWARLWGRAPGEDPATVAYWLRENLRSPEDAVESSQMMKARIRRLDSSAMPGAQVTLSGASSFDPLNRALGYHWLGSNGQLLHEGVNYAFTLPDQGIVSVRLRIWDLSDPKRTAVDSLSFEVGKPGVAKDSLTILDGPNGNWKFGEAWGQDSAEDHAPIWVDSVKLPASDQACSAILKPARGSSILKIPFGSSALNGVRFQAPTSSLDRTRFTHLEFWVASSREWPDTPDRERAIRVWLTHQVAPVEGYNNHHWEEDFSLLQAYLPKGQLARNWQKVSIPVDELYQQGPLADGTQTLFLKFARDYAQVASDTTRDADLFLSGMRWVRHLNDVRVTTRRVGALVTGNIWDVDGSYGFGPGLDGTLRLHNPTSKNLLASSLKVRLPVLKDEVRGSFLEANSNNIGTDESVSSEWFSPYYLSSQWSAKRTDRGLSADGEYVFEWGKDLVLPAGKAWQGKVRNPWKTTRPAQANSWFMPFYRRTNQQLYHHVLVEAKRPDGEWGRLWGLLPGERFATTPYWSVESLRAPADTIANEDAFQTMGNCSDTVTVPVDTVPTDTGSAPPSGGLVTPGDPVALPGMGRDPGLTTRAVEVGGRPGVQVVQTKSEWSIKHTVVFDTAWARRKEILVDVWIDPATMSGAAWVGSLCLSTFDGYSWLSLDPGGGADLKSAVGTWQTFRFAYDPSRYVLGRSFDLQFLANGHMDASSTFGFVIGGIRLGDPAGEAPITPDPPNPVPDGTAGIRMDALTPWNLCNGCELRTEGNGSVIAVVPAGGAPALETKVVVDQAFRAGKTFHVDIRSEYPLGGWETATVILVNEASSRWWDAQTIRLPVGIEAGWTRLSIPYDGSLYALGTTTTLKIAINSTAPASKRVLFSNLTWVP